MAVVTAPAPTYHPMANKALDPSRDPTFCCRVIEAIALGYKLYGSSAATFNGENVIVAQTKA